jgi:chemotaxis protein methyltransferase CheR
VIEAGSGPADVDRFRGFVRRHLGLQFEQDQNQLEKVLRRRAVATGRDCRAYLREAEADPGPELEALTGELTVGETYFLRHVEQFQALTETVVERRLSTPGRSGGLRLLSAGCSTGEEAYSLAIALQPTPAGPAAGVLGVDLNPASLARARQARYTTWSLRAVPTSVQERWFTPVGDELEVVPQVRRMVRFERHNFAAEEPELWRPASFDVVFCRNVLMYLTPDVMAAVVHKINRALAPGGYLFLGSAETLRGIESDFQLCEGHGAFYYQKPLESRSARPAAVPGPRRLPVAARANPAPALRPALNPPPGDATPDDDVHLDVRPDADDPRHPGVDGALELMRQERFHEALAAITDVPDSPDTRLLRAALLTQAGDAAAAEDACRPLLSPAAATGLQAGAHALIAIRREAAGDLPAAIEHALAATRIDPAFAMPHVQLGRLARRVGDLATAQREFSHAAARLPGESERRILLFGGGFDRTALIGLCELQSERIGAGR